VLSAAAEQLFAQKSRSRLTVEWARILHGRSSPEIAWPTSAGLPWSNIPGNC
jgi:hypothetical protein